MPIISIIAAVFGIIFSSYSVFNHVAVRIVGTTEGVCNLGAVINCTATSMSSYSEIMDVPIGVYGTLFFLVCLIASLLQWKSEPFRKPATTVLLVMSSLGAVTSFILAGISWFILNTTCPVCVTVYVSIWFLWGSQLAIGVRNRHWQHFSLKPLLTAFVIGSVLTGVAIFFFPSIERVLTNLVISLDKDKMKGIGIESLLDLKEVHLSLIDRESIRKNHAFSGPLDAPVVLTEFLDFECMNCATFSKALDLIKLRFKDDVLVVGRHFPLDTACNGTGSATHPTACVRASWGICANRQNRFWTAANLLFNRLFFVSTENALPKLAETMPDPEAFARCLKDPRTKEALNLDVQEGQSLKLAGTPGIFVNGRKYTGRISVEGLSTAINLILQEAKEVGKQPPQIEKPVN